ncbi:MAG: penicillin-binding protein 1C [Bacteroidia bacterium]
MLKRFFKSRKAIGIGLFLLLSRLFWAYFFIHHFERPYSSVIVDDKGELLQARIASDGQWRFPEGNEIPEKFKQAICTFEDKRFYQHFGIDPLRIVQATYKNIRGTKVKSGASTLSMQVVRLARGKERTIIQKIIEAVLAFELEITTSKKRILEMYCAHAPFGGNVVGLEAASWRYFGRPAQQLSWAEVASLAILPNHPSMVRPGKNKKRFLEKRNVLLKKMYDKGLFNHETYALSILEHIPEEPYPLPELAPHLLNSLMEKKIEIHHESNGIYQSTIQSNLQKRCKQVLLKHHELLTANGINNAAVMVMKIESGEVLAYLGNVYQPGKPDYDSYVDMIPAKRSPGSTLKPILYAAMLQDGLILPHTLLADIPTQIAGYSPKNFDLTYDGAVPASKALARSLNIPAVRLLQQYKYERFHDLLKKLGIKSLNKSAGHYGLSIILGGGENSMWELAGVYSSLGRMVNHFGKNNSAYDLNDLHEPIVLKSSIQKSLPAKISKEFLLGAGALYNSFEAMKEVMRPGEEMLWTRLVSAQKIAWKTGTSFGSRDAWSIGFNSDYLVVVWAGNADGEGRAGLIGVQVAAPIMFEIFKFLPRGNWFPIPYDDMKLLVTCRKSGYLAGDLCEEKDTIWTAQNGQRSGVCPYHQMVHLSKDRQYRLNSDCESPSNMRHESCCHLAWSGIIKIMTLLTKPYHL